MLPLHHAPVRAKLYHKFFTFHLQEAAPSPELEALLKNAAATKDQTANMDDFWNQAAEKHGNKPASKEVISLEDARKLGLLPGDGK